MIGLDAYRTTEPELVGEPSDTCPYCGESDAHEVDCRTCFDCVQAIDPEDFGIARDGNIRCSGCHGERMKLQEKFRRALAASERDLEADRFCESLANEVL